MKKLLALLLSMTLVFSCVGCGSSDSAKETKETANTEAEGDLIPLKVAFCTWAGYAPVFIGVEKGYFEEAGYDVEVVIMEDESTYGHDTSKDKLRSSLGIYIACHMANSAMRRPPTIVAARSTQSKDCPLHLSMNSFTKPAISTGTIHQTPRWRVMQAKAAMMRPQIK